MPVKRGHGVQGGRARELTLPYTGDPCETLKSPTASMRRFACASMLITRDGRKTIAIFMERQRVVSIALHTCAAFKTARTPAIKSPLTFPSSATSLAIENLP